MGLMDIWFNRKKVKIDSKDSLTQAAIYYGMLPFFHNEVRGFSVAEMALPGMLFGEHGDDEGCWEWKGPVIRERTTAYGKFFRKKAGFVSLELFPDFLNYRRAKYPVKPSSTEEMILEIIRENEGLTSTDLKNYIFGFPSRSRMPWDIPDKEEQRRIKKRPSIETPLQKLQMGGWLLISDFEYKLTKRGERYGWGVAKYSTPELWLGDKIKYITDRDPLESLDRMVEEIKRRLPGSNKSSIRKLIQ